MFFTCGFRRGTVAIFSLAALLNFPAAADDFNLPALIHGKPEYKIDKALAVEAERATELDFNGPPVRSVLTVPEASGGIALRNLKSLKIRFSSGSPGKFRVRYRGNFPRGGNWNHTERLDGRDAVVQDADSQVKTGQWKWSTGPVHDLPAGSHVLELDWQGGALLDRIVIAPDEFENNESVPTSAPVRFQTELRLSPTPPPRLEQWNNFQFRNLGGGTVRAEYSPDGGRRFRSFQPGEPLNLPPGQPVLRFHLIPGNDGALPLVGEWNFPIRKRHFESIEFGNSDIRVAFAGDTGAITRIHAPGNPLTIMKSGTESPLFGLETADSDGTRRRIEFSASRLQRLERVSENSWRIDYRFPLQKITVRTHWTIDRPGVVRCSARVENQGTQRIVAVLYPEFRSLRIGDGERDDRLFQPVCSGSLVEYPASLQVPRRVFNYTALVYPGNASMCWTDLFDRSGGLYLAVEDPLFQLTEFMFSVSRKPTVGGKIASGLPPAFAEGELKVLPPEERGDSINLGFRKHLEIAPGAVGEIPPLAFGIHSGDWHWGADRYAAWIRPRLTKRPVPEWFRQDGGMQAIHMINAGAELTRLSRGNPYRRQLISMKNPPFSLTMVWAQQIGAETHWSRPPLNRYLGPDEVMRSAVGELNRRGLRAGFYLLPEQLDPRLRRDVPRVYHTPTATIPDDEIPPDSLFRRGGERDAGGRLIGREDQPSEAPMYPGSPDWRRYLDHILIDRYGRDYGADAAYLDAIGLIGRACANTAPGFRFGQWASPTTDWMQNAADRMKALRGTDPVFMGEGMSEVENQVLSCALFYFDNAPDVYRYVHPENIGVLGSHYTTGYNFLERKYNLPARSAHFELGVLYGMFFYGGDSFYELLWDNFLAIKRFSDRLAPFQRTGIFRGDAGLRYSDSDYTAKLYRRNDPACRGALAVVFNPHGKTVPLEIDAAETGPHPVGYRLSTGGEFTQFTPEKRGDVWRVPVLPDRMSAILLLDRADPVIWSDRPAPVVPGESGELRYTVWNPGAPFAGRAEPSVPRGWTADGMKLELASGEQRTVVIPIGCPGTETPGSRTVALRIGHFVREQLIGVEEPVTAELNLRRFDRLGLTLTNRSTAPRSGSIRITVPEGCAVEPPTARFELAPGAKEEREFRILRRTPPPGRYYAKAEIRSGTRTTTAWEPISPPVLNGGFEFSALGDGIPEYWNFRSPAETPRTAVMDNSTAASGKWSLRIDSRRGVSTNFLRNAYVNLPPGVRCRFRCAIRRSANHPGIFAMLAVDSLDAKNQNTFNRWIGGGTDFKLNEWRTFQTEFMSPPGKTACSVLLFNGNGAESNAVAWFDDRGGSARGKGGSRVFRAPSARRRIDRVPRAVEFHRPDRRLALRTFRAGDRGTGIDSQSVLRPRVPSRRGALRRRPFPRPGRHDGGSGPAALSRPAKRISARCAGSRVVQCPRQRARSSERCFREPV